MVRAVFFGSSDSHFSNRHFDALAEADCSVAAVVDVPPARRVSTNSSRQEGGGFVEFAREKGIPCFEPANPNTAGFIQDIRALEPDLFMAVGYMLVLKPELLGVPRVIAANFHASLLPAYRGKHPVFWALRGGEPWCGLTVHEMSSGLDTGDILFQVRVRTMETDSVTSLYERIMTASVPLVSELLAAVARGTVPRTPQPAGGASYFGATREADFRISWFMKTAHIVRWVTETPGQCFTDIGGQRMFLPDARVAEVAPGVQRAGTILALGPEMCRIACSDGSVEIRRLRSVAGKESSAFDVLRGLGLGEGAVLGGS